MPKALFWEWSWRTLLRAITFSVVLGLVWTALSFPGFGVSYDTGSIQFLIAFIFDTLFVYVAVYTSLLLGLAMQIWGHVAYIIKLGRKETATGLLWAVFASLLVNLLTAKFYQGTPTPSVTVGSVLFTAVVTTYLAQQTAYRVYYKYGVLDRRERSAYVESIKEMSRGRKFLRFINPKPKDGELYMSMITAPVFAILGIYLGTLLAEQVSWSAISGLGMSLSLCVIYVMYGILIRFFDSIRPGSKKESLYPYFETER